MMGIFLGIVAGLAVLFLLWLAAIGTRRGERQMALLRQYRYAHRGLHNIERGVPENSLLAFRYAIAGGFGAELDVHLLADGALAIAWPSKLLTAPGGETLGYVMPAASPDAKPLTGMLRAPVSRDAARRAAHGLCAAVAHAHENGLVIGDLSPNSALVGEGFAVTLIGLEHCGFQSQGKTWAAGPCPAKLAAPELLDGEPCTQASDCYALGKLVGRLMGDRDAPPNVRALSVKALHATPDERPTAKQWLEALACT